MHFASGQTFESSLPAWIETRNGNKAAFSDLGSGAFKVTDTAHRAAISSSGFGTSGNTITVTGLSNPYTTTWGSSGSSYRVNASVTNYLDDGQTCAPFPTSLSGTQSHITEIQLPNGTSYQFQYDPSTGLLSKIIYPTGGYVRYVWGPNSSAESVLYPESLSTGPSTGDGCEAIYDTIAVANRYVSFDGTNEVLEQDFTYSTTWNTASPKVWTSKRTTVTTKDLVRNTSFETQYNYIPVPPATQPNDQAVYGESGYPVERQVVYFADDGATTLETVTKGWPQNFFNGSGQDFLLCELRSPGTSQIAGVFYGYGNLGVMTDKKEYDYGTITDATSACQDSSTANPPTGQTRETVTTYQNFADTPIYPTGPSIFDRPSSVIVKDGSGNNVAETDYAYDQSPVSSASTPSGTHDETNYSTGSSAPRGNATTITKQCFSGCPNAVSTYTYDEAGQTLSMVDPCGNSACADMSGSNHTTHYDYTDSFSSCGGNAPSNGNTDAYLTQVTDPLGHITKYCYGYADGQLRGLTDENSQTTIYQYNDPLARLTETIRPDGGYDEYAYDDSTPYSYVTTYKAITSGSGINLSNNFDGFGHPYITQKEVPTSTCSSGWTTVSRSYDGQGHLLALENPFCTANDPTAGTRYYYYDALGRVTEIAEADGSFVTKSYSGNCTTETDEQSKARESCTDGLGRLTEVIEDPGSSPHLNYITNYTYDLLDNLIGVLQNGRQMCQIQGVYYSRCFSYNSLSHLTTSTNPESGTTSYTYDANANLSTKVAPLENQSSQSSTVTTSYMYDAINQVLQKSYSDGITPTATFAYDVSSISGITGLSNTIGRLVEASNSNGTTVYNYDSMGRVLDQWQCTSVNCGNGWFEFLYGYNLTGDETSISYDGGFTLSQDYDSANRVISLTSSVNDSQHPGTLVSGVTYDAPDLPTTMIYGNGLTETRAYNNRLQSCRQNLNSSGTALANCASSIPSGSVQDLSYGYYAGTTDNGNVMTFVGTGTQIFNRAYTYDSLNRIATMTDSASNQACKGLSWTIDPWGNRTDQTVTGGSCGAFHSGVGTNNQLSSPYAYDAPGNMTYDTAHAYTYDADGHITKVDGGSTATYSYDANGRRVQKFMPSGTTNYWYDANGRVRTEWDQNGDWLVDYFYLAGQPAGMYKSGTTYFYQTDGLGSTRLITALGQSVFDSMDYMPFGELMTGGSSTTHKFTGKERDSESHLDNFRARYNSSSIGRFMSPDPVGGKRIDPQTLNKYSYVRNNPLNGTDPTGLYVCLDDKGLCRTKNDRNLEDALIELRNSGGLEGFLEAYNFGKAGEDNGVTVDFKSEKELGPGTLGQTHVTATILSPGHIGNIGVHISLLSGLNGKDLEQTVAHEGYHLADDLGFLLSFNFDTGKFASWKNFTHYDSEFGAFEEGAKIKPYRDLNCGGGEACDIVAGARDEGMNLFQYLTHNVHYSQSNANLAFDPKVWPQ